jgi:hypothetical protein
VITSLYILSVVIALSAWGWAFYQVACMKPVTIGFVLCALFITVCCFLPVANVLMTAILIIETGDLGLFVWVHDLMQKEIFGPFKKD